jgi:hypothetical protein
VRPRLQSAAVLACSAALAVSVPGTYLALGGGSYSPSNVRNPCAERSWRDPGGFEAVAQQIALSALDGAACHFGVSRETLTIALATSSSRATFARQHHVDNGELENAVRRGLERSVSDAQRAGAIGGWRATALRVAAEHVPVEQMANLVDVLRSLAAKAGEIPSIDLPDF